MSSGLVAVAVAKTSELNFKRLTSTLCGPVRLHTGWTSASQLSCFTQCQDWYGAECRGFLYNKVTKICVPSSGLSAFSQPPNSSEGNFYFSDSCEAYPDFGVYTIMVTLRTALFNISVNYTTARGVCQCLNSRLYVANEMNKMTYLTLSTAFSEGVWIGLDDIQSTDNFVWANGEPLSGIMRFVYFRPFTPDHDGHCVVKDAYSLYLDDKDCSRKMHFLCEKTSC